MERNIKNKDEDSKVILKLKKIDDSAITPAYSSNGAAGMDLYSIDNVTINPCETVKIHTGICMLELLQQEVDLELIKVCHQQIKLVL